MKPELIIYGGTIITMDENHKTIENSEIHIKGGKIIKISEVDENQREKYTCKYINAKGKFIFPGLINTHTHIFQTLIRGFGQDLPVLEWFEKTLDPVVENLTAEDAYLSAKLGAIEAIKSGTTTILDYNYPHPYPGMAEETIRALREVGLRGILARGIIDAGNVHKKIIHSTREELDACVNLIKEYNNTEDKMISVWLAPYSIFSTSKEAFIEAKAIAKQYNTWLTMHAATPSSIEASIELYGMDDITFEESIGFLSPEVLAVHCCGNISESVLNIMKDYDVKISHNPISNCYLGEGIAPIKCMIDRGIKISLATDGPASNNNQDMISVLKFTALLQKVTNLDPTALSAIKTLEMATIEGAECLGMEKFIGSIEIGKQADLIIVDFMQPNTIAFHDPISSLVYSASQENIQTVIINGKVVMENREVKFVNEYETLNLAVEASKKLEVRSFKKIS